MKVIPTKLPGVVIIEPEVFGDGRGFFLETYQRARYADAGIPARFVQDNFSRSGQHILRGLHHQYRQTQGKLVSVVSGAVFDVAVDIRAGSPTFGQHASVVLDDENRRQFYVPAGFAHGFCVLSARADFFYKCTDYYCPEAEVSIRWDDPDLNIPWPVAQPQLSPKDAAAARLYAVPEKHLPPYQHAD